MGFEETKACDDLLKVLDRIAYALETLANCVNEADRFKLEKWFSCKTKSEETNRKKWNFT